MLRYFLRTYPTRTAALVLLLLAAGIAEGIGVLTLFPLLQLMTESGETLDSPAASLAGGVIDALHLRRAPGPILVLIVLALWTKGLFRWFAMRAVGDTVARVARDLRLRLVRAVLAARWHYYAGQRAGALAVALSRDAFWSAHAYRHACSMFAALIELAIYAVLVLLLSPATGLLALAAGVVLALALGGFVRWSRQAGVAQTARARMLVIRFTDVVGGFKAIKAMGREAAYTPAIEADTNALERAERRQVLAVESLHAFQEPLLAVLLAAGAYVVLSRGAVPIATLLMAALLFQRVMSRAHRAQAEYQAIVAAEAAFRTLQTQIESAESEQEPAAGVQPPPLHVGIALHDVRFAYGDNVVFDGLSLDVPAGQFLVLAGPSGAGKTTLLDLIAGLRRPDAGTISVDGVVLDAIDPVAWRRSLGFVPEEPPLLHDTVEANLTSGDAVSREDIDQALRQAGAHEFVAALPHGLATVIGERGARISAGQRQRLAIARALLVRPRLLLLDEPTSGLDAETEAELCNTLAALRGEITIIAASHRTAVCDAADAVAQLRARTFADSIAP